MLALANEASVVAAAPNLLTVVYNQLQNGRTVSVLHHVVLQRQVVMDGALHGVFDNGRALYSSWKGGGLFEADAETGQTRLVFSGEYRYVGITGNVAVLSVDVNSKTENRWVYFSETGEMLEVATLKERPAAKPSVRRALPVLVQTPNGFAAIDSDTRGITMLPAVRAITPVFAYGVLLYLDNSHRAWAWAPGHTAIEVGRDVDWSRYSWLTYVKEDEVLLTDGTGRLLLWNIPNFTVRELFQDVEVALRASHGTHVVLSRRVDDESELLLMDVASGTTNVLTRVKQPVYALHSSPDARRIAFVTREVDVESWDTHFLAHLFNLDTGAEVPLQGLYASWSEPWTLDFHAGGTILRSWRWDGVEQLHDTTTGRVIYSSKRSVVGGEGRYSRWGATDTRFYTPVGGYTGYATDYFVWNASDGSERLVVSRGYPLFLGSRRDVLSENAPSFDDRAPDLTVLDHATDTKWLLSSTAGEVAWVNDDLIWFFDQGALMTADLSARTKSVLAKTVRAPFRTSAGLIYSDDSSVCFLPWPKP